MKFGRYQTEYSRLAAADDVDEEEWYIAEKDRWKQKALVDPNFSHSGFYAATRTLVAEIVYSAISKPYYNVYPCILDVCDKLPESTPVVPFYPPDLAICTAAYPDGGESHSWSLSLRFPENTWPRVSAMLLAMIRDTGSTALYEFVMQLESGEKFHTNFEVQSGATLAKVLSRFGANHNLNRPGSRGLRERDIDPNGVFGRSARFVAALGLLVEQGTGFLERDILAKDRGKPLTNVVLRRAIVRKGLGWNLGQKLEQTPHARRPHWAHRWMKPKDGESPVKNGLVPRLRPIKGSLVKAKSVEQVPTGYEDWVPD